MLIEAREVKDAPLLSCLLTMLFFSVFLKKCSKQGCIFPKHLSSYKT
jgi:hypothetical protein